MDPYFTDEHRMFQKSIRDFCEKEISPNIEKWEEEEIFPAELFPKAGALGFIGTGYPEEYGGLGADKFFDAIFTEETARVAAGISASLFVQSSIGTFPIFKLGSEEQKKKYLAPAIRGEKVGAFGLTEPGAGSDAAGLTTTAKKDGDSYIINGTKMFITNFSLAHYYIVAAYTDKSKRRDGIALFLVDKGTPGAKVGKKLHKMGCHTADTGELIFEDCRIPAENLLGEETGGFSIVVENLVGGRMLYGARCLGIAGAAFDAALKYAKERTAFGKTIGSFQLIKGKLAHMAAELEAIRALTYSVIHRYNQGENIKKEASMVKLLASEMAQRVTWEAVQIHGGYGYMREYPVERYFRDARLLTIPEGTSEIHQLIIASELGL